MFWGLLVSKSGGSNSNLCYDRQESKFSFIRWAIRAYMNL